MRESVIGPPMLSFQLFSRKGAQRLPEVLFRATSFLSFLGWLSCRLSGLLKHAKTGTNEANRHGPWQPENPTHRGSVTWPRSKHVPLVPGLLFDQSLIRLAAPPELPRKSSGSKGASFWSFINFKNGARIPYLDCPNNRLAMASVIESCYTLGSTRLLASTRFALSLTTFSSDLRSAINE